MEQIRSAFWSVFDIKIISFIVRLGRNLGLVCLSLYCFHLAAPNYGHEINFFVNTLSFGWRFFKSSAAFSWYAVRVVQAALSFSHLMVVLHDSRASKIDAL